jgi:subtilisin family serine protease
MRKSAFSVLITAFILLVSVLSSTTISSPVIDENEGIGQDPLDDGWWNTWNRDINHNKIDDVLDVMINYNPGSQRTRVFIDYFRKTTQDDVARLSSFDFDLISVFNIVNTISARNVLLSDIPKLSQLPGVVMIEYEDEVHALNDVGARTVKARNSTEYSPNTVWDMDILGRGVSIAILDSGVDDGPSPAPPPYHLSLDDLDDDIMTMDDPKFIAGLDAIHVLYDSSGNYNPDDGAFGHGTHVAGTALGTGGTGDYKGVAPQARLVDIKVMENWGSGTMGEVIRGIDWAVEHKDEFNIRILSMSLGGNYDSNGGDAASQAVNAAVDAGLVAVISAGNGGSNTIGPPAAADKALVVGALDDHNTVDRSDDNVWGSSNVGPRADDGDSDNMDELKPDILAPGVNIMSAKSDTTGSYIQFSGTSMAAPHVAGVVALMLEANPDLTPEEVKDILHMTAEMPEEIEPSTEYDDVYNYAYGWGFIDAFKAVKMAMADNFNPPVISNIEVDVSGNTALITWETDKPANSIVDYGTTTALGTIVEDLDNFETSHSMTLSDLDLDTDYYFNIQAYDDIGIGPGESGIQGPFHTDDQLDITPPQILEGPKVLDPILENSATIYWRTDEDSTSSVEYGFDITYGNTSSDINLDTEHTIILINLQPDTLYHYRVTSTDSSGNTKSSSDEFFTTAPEKKPLEITFGPVVNDITHESATIVWETDDFSTSLVRYGKTLNYEVDEIYIDIMDSYHSIGLTGLEESTKYYYMVESINDEGTSVNVGDESNYFTTLETPDTIKPVISDVQITFLSDTQATFQWQTDEQSTSWVDYGQGNPGTEPSVGFDEFVTAHNITLSDLSPSTKYYFQVRSKDKSENEALSAKDTFITKALVDIIPPQILTGPSVLAIGETSATIVWTTDEDSDSVIHYGPTSGYGLEKSDLSMKKSHQIILTDLDPSTTYFFKAASTDATGNTIESEDTTFKTLDNTSPITIELLNLNSGDTISGVKTIEGRVTGGLGSINSIRYKIDDEEWNNLGSGSTFNILIDTSKYSEGSHTITVEAKVGEMLMQEETNFIVERASESSEESFLLIVLLAAAVIMVLVMIIAVSTSRSRRKARPSESQITDISQNAEPSFFEADYGSSEALGIGFIPDMEPEPSFEIEDDISFVPDSTAFSNEPEISFIPDSEPVFQTHEEMSFVPDSEPVLFNISEEMVSQHLETVRCPRCKSMFDADTSLGIECPNCGFSASFKR